uniref:Death inducer-obliterator 1 n=2 Tax=Sander lucioperca TaxID=283035 RepID=A0A8C9XCM8_SANLU
MSKDPMWIPKPPVLYGSDKLEIFQPYDPETPASTTPPGSPPCPGSPSDSSSSGSVTIPSPFTSFRTNPPVPTSATQSTSNSISDKNPTTASSDKTPLQTILNSLFGNKQTDSVVSSDGSSTTTTTTTTTVSVKKVPMFSQTRSMVDPIVEQYGQKSKVKKIEEEENDFDRPYDPEEEYDPAMAYGMVAPQSIEKIKADGPAVSGFVDDGVAYDPEDETIFADIQSDIVVTKPPVPTQTSSSPSCPAPISIQIVTPAPTSTPALTSTPAGVRQNIPTGTVVVSAATLTEQQRMLEELNKQIEEQKRQLKEQEEALRQQREAVGMFMAHFSVSDSLMSPPQKSLPVSQLSESTDKTSNLTETVDSSNVESQTVKLEDTTAIPNLENDADNVTEQDETQENVKESSAGEIEDSDVAYDPEDESLFNEIQDDVFQGGSIKTRDSSLSRTGHSASRKGTVNAYHSRKRRLSPKKRSHRERDHHRSPSRRSQRRSPSHSRRRRERDRHRRSERDRSRHRARDQSERQGHHSKERSTHRHSHGRRRSPSSLGKKDSGSLSPKQHREPSPQVLEKSKPSSVLCNAPDSVVGQFVESNTSLFTSVTFKNNPDGNQLKSNLDESIDKGFSPRSHGLLHNVKLETSEPPKSQELKTTSVSDHDDTCSGSSTQVDKPSQRETLFSDKFESTVPLRVIDPPIRDSPQSPDPEPQFVNPSSTALDSVKIEEIRLPEMHTSVSMPHVKVENNCLPICGQATMSNILWPTVGGPISNVRNMDFRTLNLQSSGVSDTGMIEEDKRIEGGSPGLKHQKILGHGGGHSDPATDPDIQGSGPKIDPVTKRPGPGISDPGIRNAGSHMKELVHRGPQIDLRETGIRFPGPDMRGPGMKGISPSICPGSDTLDLAISGQGKHVRDPGTGMQGSEANVREPVIQQHNSDRIGSLPVIRGSGMRSPVQNMQSSTMQCVNQEVKGPGPDMRHSELEVRGKMLVTAVANSHMGGSDLQNQRGDPIMKGPPSYRPGPDIRGSRGPLSAMYHPSPENADVRPGVMEIRRDQSFGGPQIEGRAPDIIGRGQKDRSESPHTGGMRSAMRGGGVRDPSPGPSFRGSGRVQMQSKHDGSPVSSSGHREHFNEPLPNIRTERMVHGPDMTEAETMHNLRNPDLTESYMEPGQDMDSMGGSDTRGDGMLNITNPDWRGPGPGFVGPDMRGQRSQNKGLGPHLRGPDWRGLGSEIRDVWRGSDMKGSGPVRGGPFIQDEWRVHQPDKSDLNIESQGHDTRGEPMSEMRGPNMEDLRHDRRRPGGPDFMTPGPVMRGPDMEVPMHDRRGPRGPDLMRPEPEWSSPTMGNLGPGMQGPGVPDFVGPGQRRGLALEGPGPNSRGPGDPHFRGPGPERKGPAMEGQGPAGPDFKVPWPERRGPGGPDFRGPGPEWRVPAMEGPATDMQGLGGPDFSEPEPERRGLSMEGPGHVRRGPGGPDFRGLGPERRGPGMEGPGPDRRGPGGPHFSEPASKRRSLSMESPGPARRGPGDPGFSEPGPENRGLSMEGPGPSRRGPGGPDFRGRGPERRGPVMEGPGPVRRGPGGLDFRGPGPESRDLSMEGLGHDSRGPGGPDFRGPGPERRGPVMEGPGPDRRRTGVPDFRGPGPERRDPVIEGPGPDRRKPGGPDFRGPGPESRGLSMQGPGPDRRGPGGPDFRGLGPDRRGPAMEGPGPDRKGPGGLDFRGPGPEGRSLSLKRHGPDSRRSRSPDFRGAGPERRGPAMEAPGPDRRGPGGPDFSGPGPHRRGSSMGGSGPDRREIEVLDFQGPRSERGGRTLNSQEPDNRAPDGPDFRGPGCERRGPHIKGQVPDRRGPGDQNTYLMGPGPDFTGLGPERTGSGIEGPGPHSREQGRPHFRGPGPKSGQTNIEGPGPDTGGRDIRGPRPERPGSSMQGPGPNRRVPGGPDIRRPGLHHSGPNREGPGPDRRTPEMEGTGNSRSFPGGPLFRGPETERRPPDREGPESDRRGPHFREVRPEITVMEGPGPDRKHPRGPDFRGPGCLSRGPDIEGPWPGRQEPGSSDFREPGPERRGPDMEGPEPDWRRSGGPDFRGPGSRQKAPNTEGLRHRRDDWEGADFGGSEPIQESPVIEGQGPDRTGRNLRGPRPTRGNIRGSGPNFRGSAPDRRATDTEEQWSEGIGPNMEAQGNERECSGDDWKIHGNRGSGPIQEGPGQQVQEHSRQGPRREWRGPESRGPRPIQERPTMPFLGPLRAPADDWSGPGVRGPGPVHGDPDMVCPGPGRGRPGNGWNEPDRGDAGPNRRGPGPIFSGEREPDNRGQGRDRRGLGMREPVSDMRGGPDMGNDWRQPDIRGNMRGTNMEGPGARSGAPDSMICPNGRGFEMEGLDRRVPRGPDFRHQGPENRNSNIEGPGTDGRFSNCGGLGSERQSVDMESPGTGRQGFEHDFRRRSRGPDIRRLGPGKTDIRGPAPESSDLRHGPGRWDTNMEGPGSDRRGPDMMGRGLDSRGYEHDMEGSDIRGPGCDGRGPNMTASPHFNITNQVTRCQGPSDPNSAPCNGPLGPAQNSGGSSCPGFDNLQNQQAVKLHRHRAALLPTPTEGLIRFPNRMINNPDVFSLKRKQIGHPPDREWSRGRPVSRERELVKGQRQEQEKSPAGKISTPVDASTGGGEGKKEVGNETDKQGACVETKTKQIMGSDENKSNAQPS